MMSTGAIFMLLVIARLYLTSSNAQSHEPLSLNVELLIFTDYSIYKQHESMLRLMSADSSETVPPPAHNQIVQHIKDYFGLILEDVRAKAKNLFDCNFLFPNF
jgi:hypothetical protein